MIFSVEPGTSGKFAWLRSRIVLIAALTTAVALAPVAATLLDRKSGLPVGDLATDSVIQALCAQLAANQDAGGIPPHLRASCASRGVKNEDFLSYE